MKYIKDLKPDETIIEHYLCVKKQQLKTQQGKPYLTLELQDRTGTIDAKVWDINSCIENFTESQFIKIKGVVISYQGNLQLKVERIRLSTEGEYDLLDYIPSTDKDLDLLYNQIVDYINSIENDHIRCLVENILINNQRIATAFKTHSAAKGIHHNYMGGLIEHTLSVVKICDFMSQHYEGVNRDLLIVTALLHDIGKIYELSDLPENAYTDEGNLLGHIFIGAELISREFDNIPDAPDGLKILIKHSILSHHGELEYGSPKLPLTIESFILHQADSTDARVSIFQSNLKEDTTQGNWTRYNKTLGRYIRKTTF